MDDAYERANSIEEQAMVRVREIYTAALRKALKEKKAFLQVVEDVRTGKKKPPAYYVNLGEEAVERWKQGFIRELIRQEKVIEGIIAELNAAGVEAADVIRGSMVDIYQTNREEAVQLIGATAEQAGVSMSFAQYDKRQIAVILQENESPFSKIAYRNLGQNTAIRRRLQNELAQAAILGEGQQKLIERIRKVTGQTVAQARRVAQTERTRVQSQARWETGEEAKAAGVGVYNTWSTRMRNSRDTHISLNGKKAMQGEPFVTSAGNSLKYPGDPSAPAREVINCHCVLRPGVLLPGERLDADGNIVSEASLQDSRTSDTINQNSQEMRLNGTVRSIGKIDLDIYRLVTPDITTDDVVITDERLSHIRSRHPDDYEKYEHIMMQALKKPDYILETNAPHTAFILKASEDPNINGRLILRLHTAADEAGRKNSVITFQRIKEKEYNRLVRNKRIIYKSPDL